LHNAREKLEEMVHFYTSDFWGKNMKKSPEYNRSVANVRRLGSSVLVGWISYMFFEVFALDERLVEISLAWIQALGPSLPLYSRFSFFSVLVSLCVSEESWPWESGFDFRGWNQQIFHWWCHDQTFFLLSISPVVLDGHWLSDVLHGNRAYLWLTRSRCLYLYHTKRFGITDCLNSEACVVLCGLWSVWFCVVYVVLCGLCGAVSSVWSV